MRAKRLKNDEKSKNTKKVFTLILLFIFIFLMIFSGMKILNWIKENKKSNDIVKEIQSVVVISDNIDGAEKTEEGDYSIDFDVLKEKNLDTIAWLKVNGTSIDFPILKTKNNDYYMTRSFDKSYNSAGWPFMDYRNKFDGTDKNMVIYGHNRRDGSIFSTLKNILNKEWYNNEENYLVDLITESEKMNYQVFSVYTIEKEDYYITTDFRNDQEFKKFIDTIKKRSIKDFGQEVTENDQILTLSTCANNNQYRVVLHAKKIS